MNRPTFRAGDIVREGHGGEVMIISFDGFDPEGECYTVCTPRVMEFDGFLTNTFKARIVPTLTICRATKQRVVDVTA